MLYFRSFNRFILTSLALLGLSISTAHSAVIWNWDGTNLLGAQNVNVGGTLYNVDFIDGSCISLFSGCDELGDFDFNTKADALVASQALLDQVFIDGNGAPALFDTDASLTNGCGEFVCIAYTPTLEILGVTGIASARNDNFEGGDAVGSGLLGPSDSTAVGVFPGRNVYADWTQVSAVPVPAAIWLFGTALVGLAGFGKRKTRIAA